MPLGGLTQIVRGDVQVNLGAGDLTMPEKVSNGDEVDALAHQV